MLNKLPNYLVNRWARVVDNRIGEDVNERSNDEDGMHQTTDIQTILSVFEERSHDCM